MKRKYISGLKSGSWFLLLIGLGSMAFDLLIQYQKWLIGFGALGLLIVELLNRM